jgi:hypothetical protein
VNYDGLREFITKHATPTACTEALHCMSIIDTRTSNSMYLSVIGILRYVHVRATIDYIIQHNNIPIYS